MELLVKLILEQVPGPRGVFPESSVEVMQFLNAQLVQSSFTISPAASGWYVAKVESQGELTHHVYASDGVVSSERHASEPN